MTNPLSLMLPAYQTVAFQNVPMFRAQAWALQDAWDHGQRFTVTSADRRDAVVQAFNRKHGTNLHGQAYLYNLYLKGQGFPANPPDRGTHILRGDGVIGALHSHLQPYQLGIDVVSAGRSNDAGPLVEWLNRSGYHVIRPYHTGSEAHHINFTQPPHKNARKRLLNFYKVKH